MQTVDGLTAYIGLVPAEIIKGHSVGHPERRMHGGVPRGRHKYRIVAAIFGSASGTRISDATIVAQILGVGLLGEKTTLGPMAVADATPFGAFVGVRGSKQ